MPAFIKTKADEEKWNAIKHSVAKQRGKKVEDFTNRDWATVNAAWHKSEGNIGEVTEIAKSLTSIPSVKAPNPSATGQIAVKTPKSKKMPDAFGKPSLFFKKEDFSDIKHPTIENLRVFLENTRLKSNLLKDRG